MKPMKAKLQKRQHSVFSVKIEINFLDRKVRIRNEKFNLRIHKIIKMHKDDKIKIKIHYIDSYIENGIKIHDLNIG